MVAKELAPKVVHAHLVPEYSKINSGVIILTFEIDLSFVAFDFILFCFIFPFLFLGGWGAYFHIISYHHALCAPR
jgi:hypothetical protein